MYISTLCTYIKAISSSQISRTSSSQSPSLSLVSLSIGIWVTQKPALSRSVFSFLIKKSAGRAFCFYLTGWISAVKMTLSCKLLSCETGHYNSKYPCSVLDLEFWFLIPQSAVRNPKSLWPYLSRLSCHRMKGIWAGKGFETGPTVWSWEILFMSWHRWPRKRGSKVRCRWSILILLTASSSGPTGRFPRVGEKLVQSQGR